MDLTTIAAAAAEPLTLAEAKAHLRVDFADDDGLITALIAAARARVENFTRLRLITQTLRLTRTGFPPAIALPVWPVQQVTRIAYDETVGVEAVLDAESYRLRLDRKPREVVCAPSWLWPTTADDYNTVRVEFVAGYGASGAAVPPDLLHALRLVLGALYEYREDAVRVGAMMELPTAARHLMTPHVLF